MTKASSHVKSWLSFVLRPRYRRLPQKAFFCLVGLVVLGTIAVALSPSITQPQSEPPLWQIYERSLKQAKYVDLTHTINPRIPVWSGFGASKFEPSINPKTNKPYTYKDDGFEATHYDLATDRLGTQLDPPAHWEPNYPAIDELPATYAIRPLVVIPMQDKLEIWHICRASSRIAFTQSQQTFTVG